MHAVLGIGASKYAFNEDRGRVLVLKVARSHKSCAQILAEPFWVCVDGIHVRTHRRASHANAETLGPDRRNARIVGTRGDKRLPKYLGIFINAEILIQFRLVELIQVVFNSLICGFGFFVLFIGNGNLAQAHHG